MPNRTKQRRSGGLTLLLYQRTLHPELFRILGAEKVVRRAYEADIWLVEGGHVITFTAGKNTLAEVILTTASHWSLVRSNSHFLTDILIGDLVGVAVALGSNLVWPSKRFAMTGAGSTPRPGVVRHQGV